MMFVRPVANSMPRQRKVRDGATLSTVERIARDAGVGQGQLSIEQFAIGGQARLFMARAANAAGDPVVIKIFNPAMPHAASAMSSAFDTLRIAHQVLDGRQFQDWTLRVPRPIHKSDRDGAMAMSLAAGVSVYSMLSDPDYSAATMDSIASSLATAMRHFWCAAQRQYGDMNLHNVLCAASSRALWLVDCGIPAPRWECGGVAARWAPASRDLGYLLYYTASNVRATWGKPMVRIRQDDMCRRIVQDCAAPLCPTERAGFLDEVLACARVHLSALHPSASASGFWRWIVRRVASRSIQRAFTQLRSDAGTQHAFAAALKECP